MLGQLANVRAGNERLLARPGQDNHAHPGIILNLMKRRAQLFHRGHIQRVKHLRPVHGDVGNGVFLFEENVGEGHRISAGI